MKTMTLFHPAWNRRVQFVCERDTGLKCFRWYVKPSVEDAKYTLSALSLIPLGGVEFPRSAATERELISRTVAWAKKHPELQPRARWIP